MSAEPQQSCLTLKDGTDLIADIWIPEGSGPWPALLMRQPYGRRIASTITLAHPSWWTSWGYLGWCRTSVDRGPSGRFAGSAGSRRYRTVHEGWGCRNAMDDLVVMASRIRD